MKRFLTFLMSSILLLTFFYTTNVKANTYFSLQYTSNAYYLQNNQSIPINGVQDTTIPYGTTIQINYGITNNSGTVPSHITIVEKEGLTYLPYYNGVLKVNGRNVSEQEYTNFITNGNPVTLSNETTNIQIHMMSTGSYTNKITTDLKVYSDTVTSGAKSSTTEHAFYYNFGFQERCTIQFYDDTNFIQSLELYSGNSFQIPNVSKDGHHFIGFNTKKDGSGEYLQTAIATTSNTYYAIYEINTYQIRYFINDELYAQQTVEHGNDATEIMVEMKEFLKWDKDLSNVVKDIDTYAIFSNDKNTDKAISDYKISFSKKDLKTTNGIQKEYNYQIFYEDENVVNQEIISDYEVREVKKVSPIRVILFVSAVIIFIVLFIFKKVKK